MRGGKKKTYNPAKQIQQQTNARPENISVAARNLRDNQLGGVIFGCKHNTIGECLSKQLFGLPLFHYSYVKNIKPGLPLFLFNYSDRKMHGIFEAASAGQMYIDKYAWTDAGLVKTAFPAQFLDSNRERTIYVLKVRICIKTQCLPILENQYKTVIGDNYYNPVHRHFYFELDHAQTRGLISLFKPAPTPANIKRVPAVSSKNGLFEPLLSMKRKASVIPALVKTKAGFKDFSPFGVLSNSSNVVPDNWCDSDAEKNASLSKISTSNPDEKDMRELVSDWEDLDDDALRNQLGLSSNPAQDNQDSSDESAATEGIEALEGNYPYVTSVNGENHTSLEHAPNDNMFVNSHDKHSGVMSFGEMENEEVSQNNPTGVRQGPNKLIILQKLKELSVLRERSILSSKDVVDDGSDQCVPEEAQINVGFPEEPFKATQEVNTSFEQYDGNAELLQIISELTKKAEALEKKQIESDQEILFLREVVKDSGRKVHQLEYHIEELQFKYNSSLSLLGGTCTNVDRPSIFLIGGYNDITWLSSLDSFSPKTDRLTPLKQMSSARSYASVAALKDVLFVFGGGDGSSWYHTVECYNTRSNEWMMCPRLNREKGSLAGATLNNKIFAIGGGDGCETFSEVEMFDPALGKWIYSQAMLQRRFAPGAAELNGALYAVGGYDGKAYLQSAERYDPREGFWVRLPSMNIRRGCHSVAVLGEALYALGGYDGDTMVSSVEIFDPRLDSWRMGDPMSAQRGYASAVTLNDSLFVIGGLRFNEQIIDTVEVYNQSGGWSIPGFKSIGKRCFSAAVVMY